jgi:hypothetical protein
MVVLLLAVEEVKFGGVQLGAQTRHLVVDLEIDGRVWLHGDDELVAGPIHAISNSFPVQVSRDITELDADLHSEKQKGAC